MATMAPMKSYAKAKAKVKKNAPTVLGKAALAKRKKPKRGS